jgi:hypothetical protein
LTLRNGVHVRNLDASYIRFIGCTCVFEGLENLEVDRQRLLQHVLDIL